MLYLYSVFAERAGLPFLPLPGSPFGDVLYHKWRLFQAMHAKGSIPIENESVIFEGKPFIAVSFRDTGGERSFSLRQNSILKGSFATPELF